MNPDIHEAVNVAWLKFCREFLTSPRTDAELANMLELFRCGWIVGAGWGQEQAYERCLVEVVKQFESRKSG